MLLLLFFPSGPSNRDIMHRQPSIGVLVRDWRSAVQFFILCVQFPTLFSGSVHREMEVTRPGLEEFSGVSSRTFISLALFALLWVQGEGLGSCLSKRPATFLPIESSSVNHSTHKQTNKKKEKQKYIQGERKQFFLVKILGNFL